MPATAKSLSSFFRPIYGQPAWCVQAGHGSFLTMEFGKPHLSIREPIKARGSASATVRRLLARRNVQPCGEWHLWIYCCAWRLRQKGRAAGSSASKAAVRAAAATLDGQVLTRVVALPGPGQTRFEFDLGGVLETRPYDEESEQWFLYGPDGNVLTLRYDSRCSYEPASQPDELATWFRVRKAPRAIYGSTSVRSRLKRSAG